MNRLRPIALTSLLWMLGGCSAVVLDPSGDIAVQQRDLLLDSTWLMLIIIVPVMALTALFAWRYRQSNKSARYEPDWDHSTQLELVIWGAPLLIVICLGALTWMGTHLLDPYRPIDRIAEGKPVPADAKPLVVDVVALDWKWLFIYPQYGIATVNDLAAPVDRPIEFRITASSVMNSFYVPALAGQIYAMPGMETSLHAVINKAGLYRGISANYSGDGFSGMHFTFHGLGDADFDKWIDQAKTSGKPLNRADYLQLARPSENQPVSRYDSVETNLYKLILNMCVEPGKMCMNEMMSIDARGGTGLAGMYDLVPLAQAGDVRTSAVFGPEPSYLAKLCGTETTAAASTPLDLASVPPVGMPLPSFTPISAPSTFPSMRQSRPSKS